MVTNDDGMGCAVLRAEEDMELWSVREVASPSVSPLPCHRAAGGVGGCLRAPPTVDIIYCTLHREGEREKQKGTRSYFNQGYTINGSVAEKCKTNDNLSLLSENNLITNNVYTLTFSTDIPGQASLLGLHCDALLIYLYT